MKKTSIKSIFLLCVLLPSFVLSAYAARSGQTQDLLYVDLLFDTSYVHSLDIRLTDGTWDDFISTCTDKAYWACDLTIDGEVYKNAAIRAKGNSSMQMIDDGGKYSFKIEFDHFSDNTYHGLDKLNLNNMVVDDSSMRDFLVYNMMNKFGVDAPLCSYIFVTVNGEDWGLYLALEGVEDAFMQRNYGTDDGDLYKPDSISSHKNDTDAAAEAETDSEDDYDYDEDFDVIEPDDSQTASGESAQAGGESAQAGGGPGGGMSDGSAMGSDDTKLLYIDNDPASYPYIFDSAKTDVTRRDKRRLIRALKRLNKQKNLENTLDIDEVLRYFVAHIFVCNYDSYTGIMIHNYYLYEEDGILSMIPWDYNQAFGDMHSTPAESVNAPIDTPTTADLSELPMISWIFDDPTYTSQYHATFLEFVDRFCSSGWIEKTIRDTEEMIAPYVARDPNAFCTEEEFHTAADELLTFCRLRAESVEGQLVGTVPSTDAEQALEPEKLIDTSELASSSDSSSGEADAGSSSDEAAAGASEG